MTIFIEKTMSHLHISTHILTKRMTSHHGTSYQTLAISTHILTKRMTVRCTTCVRFKRYFNSHPHEEDDCEKYFDPENARLFQLTSSRRGWHRGHNVTAGCQHFNSHPHEEDDVKIIMSLISARHFNSHPHEEDDTHWIGAFRFFFISTHILTKRMTSCFVKLFIIWHISTHILTKRMTARWFWKRNRTNISTHILTKRMTVRSTLEVGYKTYFNSHPHEEDDNLPWFLQFRQVCISTHILTKRMTCCASFVCNRLKYFNSHPHEEDDHATQIPVIRGQYFNSHPHEEDDVRQLLLPLRIIPFQLTSSRRGWPFQVVSSSVGVLISTHILTKRMTYIQILR